MKHYLAVIKDDSRALVEYADKNGAMSAYHHEMEYAINAGITTMCVVLNANGNIIEREKYTAPPAPVEAVEGDAE